MLVDDLVKQLTLDDDVILLATEAGAAEEISAGRLVPLHFKAEGRGNVLVERISQPVRLPIDDIKAVLVLKNQVDIAFQETVQTV